jgi:hypothetical protein
MRAFHEDGPEMIAGNMLTLTLGAAFILGGIGATVTGAIPFGLSMMLIGCYIAAASLVALRDGPDALNVFAPAAVSAVVAIMGLALAATPVV